MRAAHEAQLWLGVRVLPDAGVALADTLQLRVVDHVHRRTLADERFALLDGLWREMLDMIQPDRAVRGGGRAEVLEVADHVIVQLRAEEFVQPLDVRHFVHNLHPDRRAEQLCLRLARGAHLHDPVRAAAIVREQAEIWHAAGDGTHQLQNAGVAVAARAEHAVGIHDGGRLRPREHLAHLRLVSDLVQIAGAGKAVLVEQAHLVQLLFIARLLLVHELIEYKILQGVGWDVRIQRQWVCREFLLGKRAALDEFIIQVIDRFHDVDAEADDRMSIGTRNWHHLFRAEGLAVHHKSLHDLGHDLALAAVEHGLLFRG